MKSKKWFQAMLVGWTAIGCLFAACACTVRFPSEIFAKEVIGQGEVITRAYEGYEGTLLRIKDIHVKQGNVTSQVNVDVCAGGAKKVEITMQESLFEYLSVDTAGDRLSVKGNSSEVYVTEAIGIRISGYRFDEIDLATAVGTVEGQALAADGTLSLSGASAIRMDGVEGEKLRFDLSGASLLECSDVVCRELSIGISGASKCSVDMLRTDALTASLSGASKLVIEQAEMNETDVNASAASGVLLQGTCQELRLVLSGASSFEGMECSVKNATVELSGASTAWVYADETLGASLSGASRLVYGGACQVTSEKVSGGSTIERRN
ncbi:MAG: GIN domain-containing protein [Christensenellaceae bacterium]